MLVQHNSPGMADQKFRRVATAQRNSSKPDVQSLSNRENPNRSLAVPATDVSVADKVLFRNTGPKVRSWK